MRAHLSAFLRTRVVRVAALAATSLVAVTCHSEPTAGCTPTILVFTVQPGNVAAGAGISATVEARNNSGAVQTCFTSNVAISFGANPGGGTLGGTTSRAAVGGVASFTGLIVTKKGAGYTLAAASSGLSSATSANFTVSAGPATALTITTQPTNAQAGGTIGPAMVVTAIDQHGNVADGFGGNVTVTITPGTGTAGAVLSGTTTATAALGVASLGNLRIDKTGNNYSLTAASTGLVPAVSSTFNIAPGPTTQFVFTTPPSNVAAGAVIAPPVVVTAQDAQGDTTPPLVGAVTVAIGTNPATGTLSGTKTVNAVADLATFSTLSIDKPGTGYTLTATGAGVAGTFTSGAFNVTVGVLSQLVFSQQPNSAVAGVAIAPAMTVTAQDAVGNTVTTFNGSVTLAISTNPAGGTLFGTAAATASSGVATFAGLSIDKASAGYVLTATAGAVSKQSLAFTISPAAPTQLVFTTQPVQTAAGATIPTTVVTAEDQFFNVATGFTNPVTVAISSGTGKAGATLSGTKTVSAASGVAAFATLSIDSVGVNYTLTATATGLVGGFASASFNIVPNVATVLLFTAQPSNRTAGLAIAPSVVVTARDAKGNTATGFTGNVTMSITPTTGTAGAVLSGTPSVAAVAGIATFANLRINKSGAGYTLTASGTALTPDTSAAFNITPGNATKVAFTAPPSSQTAGVAIAPAIQVTAQDSLSNTDTAFTGSVTLAITAATGTSGAQLLGGGATAVGAGTGIATFAGVSIDSAGANYTLSATATGGLVGGPSTAFNIRPGAATQLAFTVQPGNGVAGAAIAPAVKVTARDALGNTDTSFKTGITVTITPATGTTGASPSGNVVTAASGIATFATLSIDSVGTGYRLSASAAGPIAGGPSSPFNITPGTPVQLAFLTQPTNATAGPPATIPSFQVVAQDVLGNTATSFSGNITVAIGANPGGGALAGTLIVGAVNGVATYGNLSINKSGTGYKLQASSGVLNPAASAFFNIVAGAATKLTFTVEPVNTQATPATIAPAVEVSGQDALGNTDLTYTGSVTIAIGTNPPGTGVLTGTTPVTAASGIAQFTNLAINVVGNGYTLNATALGGVTSTTSATFNIVPNVVDHVTISAVTNTTAGVAMAPAVIVTAFDVSNNVATQFTGGVTVQITSGTGTAGAHLTGGSSVTVLATAGVATFSNLRVDSAGTGYSLRVTAPAIVTSGTFNVAPAPAAVLVFTTQPGNAVAGANNALVVTARDSVGNRATSFNSLVTLALGSGPAGGTILSGGTATASSGIATFSALRNDKVGNYTLTASGGSVSTAVASNSYAITPATAAALFFTGQPHNAVAGSNNSPAIVVEARDAFGNVATGFTGGSGTVTLGFANNAGGGNLAGNSLNAVSGVATFANVTIDKTGNGYTLNATGTGGVTAVASNAFNITPDVATKLVFTTNPVTTTAGVTMAGVVVTAQDVNSNTATSFTGTVTLAYANNPGGGGLGGTLIKPAVLGVVSFSDLSINVAAPGYRFQATSGALTQGQSGSFNINAAAATQLLVTSQPLPIATAGVSLRPSTGVQVSALDQFGNLDPTFTGNVLVSKLTGAGVLHNGLAPAPGGAAEAASGGVATFSNLNFQMASDGYKLDANATGLVGATSILFDVKAAPADRLVWSGQPGATQTAGVNITPTIELTARDQFGNLDMDFTGGGSGQMTLAINTGPGSIIAGATALISGGGASFPDVQIDLVGTYTLKASSGAIVTNPLASSSFTIAAAGATHLVFSTQPTNAVAGVSNPVVVTAKDQFGNTDLTFAGIANVVQLAILTGPASVLNGFLATPVSGVATFGSFNVETVGTRTLLADGGALPNVPLGSNSFTISPALADHLIFTQSPAVGPTIAGQSLTTVAVTARDQFNNVATGYSGAVTVSIDNNPGVGVLQGDATNNASLGVATFTGLSVTKTGTGYTLKADDGAIASMASSGAFNIIGGTAVKLLFQTQPPSNAGASPASFTIQVVAADALDNPDPSYTAVVSLSLAQAPGGASLSGTTAVNAVAGVATLLPTVTGANGTYQLLATSGLLTVLSNVFLIP